MPRRLEPGRPDSTAGGRDSRGGVAGGELPHPLTQAPDIRKTQHFDRGPVNFFGHGDQSSSGKTTMQAR